MSATTLRSIYWNLSLAAFALLALLVALRSPGSAQAATLSYDANKYCDATWDARAEYAGSSEPVLIAVTDVKVNGQVYDPGWSLMGGMTWSTLPPIEGFTVARPAAGTYYWRGTGAGGAGAGVLFHRSGASVAPSGWNGQIQVFRQERRGPLGLAGAWTPDGAAQPVTPPFDSARCITVRKVVTNVTNDFTPFSGSVRAPFLTWRFSGLRETSSGLVWAPTFYGDFTVSEDAAPGYITQGYLAVRGTRANCPATPADSKLMHGPLTFTLNASAPNVTVCIYNQRAKS